MGMAADPAEDVESTELRHFQIEQDEIGQRELVAALIFPDAHKVSDGFLAIANNLERDLEFGRGKRPTNQENIVIEVFDQQDHFSFGHNSILQPIISRNVEEQVWGM